MEATLRDTEAAIAQASSTIGCQKGKDKQTPASNSNLGESSGRPLEGTVSFVKILKILNLHL